MSFDYKKDTREKNWNTESPVTSEALQTGALLRIADATELMAKNYSQLIEEAERYKRWYEGEKYEKEAAQRRIVALKGVITKLKKK